MRTPKLFFLIFSAVITILIISGCTSLNMNVLEGKAGNLKGIKSLYVQFDYSKMIVGRYDTEKDYIEHKVKDLSAKDADENWLEKWNDGRNRLYPQTFADAFGSYIKHANAEISPENKSAKYTMLVKTLVLDLGYYAFVQAKPSNINTEIVVFETSNPSNVLFRCKTYNTQGQGIRDVARIENAYKNLGALLGAKIGKEF